MKQAKNLIDRIGLIPNNNKLKTSKKNMAENAKKTNKTVKVLKWAAGIAAVLGLGYVLGNEKARTKVIETSKKVFTKKTASTEAATETATETVAETTTTTAPAEPKETKAYNNADWKKNNYNQQRRQYNN